MSISCSDKKIQTPRLRDAFSARVSQVAAPPATEPNDLVVFRKDPGAAQEVLDAFERVLPHRQASEQLLRLDPKLARAGLANLSTRTFLDTKYLTLVGSRSLPAGPLFSVVAYSLTGSVLHLDSTVLNATFDSAKTLPPELGAPRGYLRSPAAAKQSAELEFGFAPHSGKTSFLSVSDAAGSRQEIWWKRQAGEEQEVSFRVGEDGVRSLEQTFSQEQLHKGANGALGAYLSERGSSLAQLQEQLFANLPLTPGKLHATLRRHLKGEDLCLSWEVGQGSDTVGIDLIDDTRNGVVAHSLHVPGTHLPPALQAKGIGKTLVANQVGLAHRLGAQSVELEAGDTVGGYAWARFGFQLRDDGEELNEAVAERAATLPLDAATQKQIQEILASPDPKRVWSLADLKTEVLAKGQKTSLGKALLLGTRWNATLPLNDQQVLRRLSDYCQRPATGSS